MDNLKMKPNYENFEWQDPMQPNAHARLIADSQPGQFGYRACRNSPIDVAQYEYAVGDISFR